ncbi:MAG: LacI family DNA-binding transcriptional regulator [Kiritimatiellia bacterium]
MLEPRPTLKAIGEKAGVSSMTVSLALRGDPRISKATRNRVRKAAERMGWRPNPVLSRMMSEIRRQGQGGFEEEVAVLTVQPPEREEKGTYLPRLYDGIRDRLESLGYVQSWFHADEWVSKPVAFRTMLRTRGIRGMVLCPFLPDAMLEAIEWDRLALAHLNAVHGSLQAHQAHPDQYHNMLLLLDALRERGYRRVGFATTLDIDERVEHRWLAGFLASQHRGDIDAIPPLIRPMHGITSDAFIAWCREHRPDAVITTRHEPVDWVRGLGKKAPDLFAPGSASPLGPFAGIDEQVQVVGAAAVDLVTSQLLRNESGPPEHPKTILIQGRFVSAFH